MRPLLGLAVLALIVGGPIAFHYGQKKNLRNFRVVEPGVMYRSGKLSPAGLDAIIHTYGIKTIVNFRAFESGEQPDPEEEAYCRAHGIHYERVVYREWQPLKDGGPIPGDQSVAEFFKIIDQRKEQGPILVHCLAGKHRTGAFVALYRMEYQGWPNGVAIDEMQEGGYEGIANEDDVRGYLERFVPRAKR